MEIDLVSGNIYGIVDNGVLIFCAFIGFEIDVVIARWFNRATNPFLSAVIGAAIGNCISDFLGAVVDPSTRSMAIGITLGCAYALVLIPVFNLVFKNKNN
jgi:hypothetical protein